MEGFVRRQVSKHCNCSLGYKKTEPLKGASVAVLHYQIKILKRLMVRQFRWVSKSLVSIQRHGLGLIKANNSKKDITKCRNHNVERPHEILRTNINKFTWGRSVKVLTLVTNVNPDSVKLRNAVRNPHNVQHLQSLRPFPER